MKKALILMLLSILCKPFKFPRQNSSYHKGGLEGDRQVQQEPS